MIDIDGDRKRQNDLKKQAFYLQFGGDEFEIRQRIRTYGLSSDCCPVNIINQTGLFGILEAIISLKLTSYEISTFYVHRHVEPYNDPLEFTKGIIKIVQGMTRDEINKEYGDYFSDGRIVDFLEILTEDTKFLLSFCYDKDDFYEYIPDGKDLYNKFQERYYNLYHQDNNYVPKEEFLRIDGKLFRTVCFLVKHGYKFPNLDSLFDNQKEELIFFSQDEEKKFVLNKSYARKMGDNLIGLYYFFQRNEYETLNVENIFLPSCKKIIFRNSSGNKIIFNPSFLDSDVNKDIEVYQYLFSQRFLIADITSVFDKRIENIELNYKDWNNSKEYNLVVKRKVFLKVTESKDFLAEIKDYFQQGFTFLDSENLFNFQEENIKIIDPNLKEQLIKRSLFNKMLDIITSCKKNNFSINFNQLFDKDKSSVELCDKEDNKGIIERERIKDIMYIFALLNKNGYICKDYSNLFNEHNPYIIVYDQENNKRIISRKQINKIAKIEKLERMYSKESYEDLSDSEKDLLFMLNNYILKEKLFKWLPYTAKKWLPSSAVISKIPAERSYEYFYNNNYARLGLLKEKFKVSTYEETEGIVSLGYILGLFDSKELISTKAMNYIIEYFFQKGVSALELHKIYGAIDLSKGFNKKFADFFMQHYSTNSESFIEVDLETDMTGELFTRFDEILENRSEKKIKTRTINKLLTPQDALAFITTYEIDKELLGKKIEDERYVNLVTLLMKFGASEEELKWAINLYEQALAIDEKEVKIPFIEDWNKGLMFFNSHLKNDPYTYLSGKKTNCCSTYGGYAQDRLEHVISDINWRYVTFTSFNKTFFDGLVWYDNKEKVACIDNVEGQFSKTDINNPNSLALMADTIIRYADGLYEAMNNLKIPCRKVNVGHDEGTASWAIFEYAYQNGLIIVDNNPCRYPSRNGISTDATKQFTITNEQTLSLRKKK